VGMTTPSRLTATNTALCKSISQTDSDEGGFTVPGVGDQSSTYVPGYDLKAAVDDGRC